MKRKEYSPPGSSLPNEYELVKMLGVGHGTLREALRLLEQRGVITRHPGKGTMIKKEVLLARNPLESNFRVTELIKSAKALPGIRDINIRQQYWIDGIVEFPVLRRCNN